MPRVVRLAGLVSRSDLPAAWRLEALQVTASVGSQHRIGVRMVRVLGCRSVLAVRDLALSTRFYVDVLGFQRDFGDGSDGWSFLSRGDFRVMLGECPDDRPASELGNHSYVAYVLVEGVDELYEELRERGAMIPSAPETKPWGLREFGVHTPDGHRIRFGEPVPVNSREHG